MTNPFTFSILASFKKIQQAVFIIILGLVFLIPQAFAQTSTYDETPYVTRAEFLEYVMRINLDVWFRYDCDDNLFVDANEDDSKILCSAYQHGYITASKTFRPADPITVAEAAKLFVKATYPNEAMTCKDCRWYEPAVNFLADKGQLPLVVDLVTDYLTEQDVAFMLYNRYPEVDWVGVRGEVFRETFGLFQHYNLAGERMYLGADKQSLIYKFPVEGSESFDASKILAFLKDKPVIDPGKELTTVRIPLSTLCRRWSEDLDYFMDMNEYWFPADVYVYSPTHIPNTDYYAWVDSYGHGSESGLILRVGKKEISTANGTAEIIYAEDMSMGLPNCAQVNTVSFIIKNNTLILENSDAWKGFSRIRLIHKEDGDDEYITWLNSFFYYPSYSIHNYRDFWSIKVERQWFIDTARTFEFFFDDKANFKGYRIVKNGYAYYKPSGDFNYD